MRMNDSHYYLEPINRAYPENGKMADIVQTGGGYVGIPYESMNSISVARYLYPSRSWESSWERHIKMGWGRERLAAE